MKETLDKEGISVSLMCQVFKGWCHIYRNGRVLMNKTVVKALDSRVALLKMTAACQCWCKNIGSCKIQFSPSLLVSAPLMVADMATQTSQSSPMVGSSSYSHHGKKCWATCQASIIFWTYMNIGNLGYTMFREERLGQSGLLKLCLFSSWAANTDSVGGAQVSARDHHDTD